MDLKASIKGVIGRRRRLRLALLLGAVVFGLNCSAPSRAAAAVDLFLNWPGIAGDSASPGFVGQIILLSYSQTASNTASNSSNTPPKGICGQITVTKHLDKSSPVFLGQVLLGTRTPGPVTISFAKTGEKDVTFYKVDLHDVVPVSITQSDSPSGGIVETLVFMATRFQFSFVPQNTDGSQGRPVTFGFDCRLDRRT